VSAKRRLVGTALTAVLFAAIPIAMLAVWLTGSLGGDTPAPQRAVIVDQLAVTDPNPEFVRRATKTLQDAGYAVDYMPKEAVDVELYRILPKLNYSMVILRSHSAAYAVLQQGSNKQDFRGVALFTNEPYDKTKHVQEQRSYQVTMASYPDAPADERFFSIDPRFVASAMQGQFHGTTIILMGCAGLSTDDLARAFIARGASRFVSWDRDVTAEHTDKATEQLIKHLAAEHAPVDAAVLRTNIEVGPDPSFGSLLLAYP
jgi:hypothetical protein